MPKTFILIITGVLLAVASWYFISGRLAPHTDIAIPTTSDPIQNISNFDDCVAAGFPIQESYPEQCRTDDGRNFTNTRSQQPAADTDGAPPEIIPEEASVQTDTAAIAAVITRAAQDFGVPSADIRTVSVSPQTWPDGCLGLARADQVCIMMLTHGYEITLDIAGETAVYRTDQTGAVVKKE